MRPTMAFMPIDGNVLKTPVIQRAALCCILLSFLTLLAIQEPLKNQSWKPYMVMHAIKTLDLTVDMCST